MKAALGMAALFVPIGAAVAQPVSCRIPSALPAAGPERPVARPIQRSGVMTGYTLALSWSPQFCRERGGDPASAFQCDRSNRFGFILHGLWPEGTGGASPQYCRAVAPPGEATLRANLCATPSVRLLRHEWAKHGSCVADTADAYFRRSGGLFAALRFPDMNALSRQPGLTVSEVAKALSRANPGLPSNAMRIETTRGGWLDEVRLCLDTAFRYTRCLRGPRSNIRVKIWRDER